MGLKEYFTKIGKTQKEIAAEIGINEKTFSNHMNGTRNVPPATALKYISYLKEHGIHLTLEDVYSFKRQPTAVGE